jgi:hypothetical protein
MSRRDTSLAAFRGIGPDRQSLKAEIHLHLLARRERGATCEELEFGMRLRHQTCSARLYELAKEGKIVDSGERRINISGYGAIVWVAVRPEEQIAA